MFKRESLYFISWPIILTFLIWFIPDDLPDDRNCECCVHCCFKYETWLSFQNSLYEVVKDPLFELFITLCIVLNTTFLALEHHGMSETVRSVLDIGNKVKLKWLNCFSSELWFNSFSFFFFYFILYRFSHSSSRSNALWKSSHFRRNFFCVAGIFLMYVS